MFGLTKKKRTQAGTGALERLRAGLARTRAGLFYDLGELFRGPGKVDAAVLDEIETRLLLADVGVDASRRIIDSLSARLKRGALADTEALFCALREQMLALLQVAEQPLVIPTAGPTAGPIAEKKPFVLLVVGVNGVGKTTTIGKVSQHFSVQGYSVLLAAGDTFRAAAAEQLKSWADGLGIPLIAGRSGADAAALVFDALQSARARKTDVLIIDTAGRLHNKSNLMEELKKIRRTIDRFAPAAGLETMLVLDAGTGQNALAQAREFNAAIGIDSLSLSKLDGTAKGGVVFALADALALPIRFIGVGEAAADLRAFNAGDFVEALLRA